MGYGSLVLCTYGVCTQYTGFYDTLSKNSRNWGMGYCSLKKFGYSVKITVASPNSEFSLNINRKLIFSDYCSLALCSCGVCTQYTRPHDIFSENSRNWGMGYCNFKKVGKGVRITVASWIYWFSRLWVTVITNSVISLKKNREIQDAGLL